MKPVIIIALLLLCLALRLGAANGLSGRYFTYNSNSYSTPSEDLSTVTYVGTRTDGPINFSWTDYSNPKTGPGKDSPAPAGFPTNRSTDYGVYWTGCIKAPYTGNVKFTVSSDDGMSLTVGNSFSLDDWSIHGSSDKSGTMAMVKDQWYAFELKWFQHQGDAVIKLQWSYTGSGGNILVPSTSMSDDAFSCAPTAVPTAVPPLTATPVPSNPVYQGLTVCARLYDFEYIPFPVSTGTNKFGDLATISTTLADNMKPKNTARWKLSLNLKGYTSSQVKIETRIGLHGFSCTSGVVDGTGIPVTPTNYSATYFWTTTTAVPFTERFDAAGDPRFTPYRDVLSTSSNPTLIDNYNWYFKDLRTSCTDPDCLAAIKKLPSGTQNNNTYAPFLTMATYSGYQGRPSWIGSVKTNPYDIPKLFRLWREGVLESRSVYTSVSGWTAYYFGVGGEIGGDQLNQLEPNGVNMDRAPYGISSVGRVDEIVINGGTYPAQGKRPLVHDSGSTWASLPWLGELWPDSVYASIWSSSNAVFGNLPNLNYKIGGLSFLRDSYADCDTPRWTLPDYDGAVLGDRGCGTLLNGNSSGTGADFCHYGSGGDTNLISDGSKMGTDFNLPMPSLFQADRPWNIDYGNDPVEENLAPYNSARTTLKTYSANSSSGWKPGFYDYSSGTNSRTSAAIRLVQPNSELDASNAVLGDRRVGYMVISGFPQQGDAGSDFIARFSLLACIRTFLDAGAPTITASANMVIDSSYPIVPIPFVIIAAPSFAEDLSHKTSISFSWVCKWARWDSTLATRVEYTENYPSGYTNPTPVYFNLKYRSINDSQYYQASSNLPVDINTYVPDSSISTNTAYTWNVSALTKGNYRVRVEAYRDPNIYRQHMSYHEMTYYLEP